MNLGKIVLSRFRNKSGGQVRIGKIKGAAFREETLTESEMNHHVHIVGASGFGKTVLLTHILQQKIRDGKGVLFIDLKGDLEILNKLTRAVREANRLEDLSIFSLTDKALSSSYDLLAGGTPTQLRDRIVKSLNWSEEYYKNQSASFLLKLLIILCWLRDHEKFSFDIATVLNCATSSEKIVELAQKIPMEQKTLRAHAQSLKDFLETKDQFNSLSGLRAQLESLVLSDFGDIVTFSRGECALTSKQGAAEPVAPGIDLFKAYTDSKIVFMFLDSRRYGETAQTVGRFILQDLKAVSARVDAEIPQIERQPFSLIIDEFADLAQEDFIGFLDRARSSKMSVVVSHQEICDLQRISPEFAGRLMGNTSTLYAFLQKRSESAEIISGIAGTRRVKEHTTQVRHFGIFDAPTGMRSQKEVEEFIIHPNIIKSLRVGQCVCVKKYPRARAHRVSVFAEYT